MSGSAADLGKRKDALRDDEQATSERRAGKGTREAVEKASRKLIGEMGIFEGHSEEQAKGALRSFSGVDGMAQRTPAPIRVCYRCGTPTNLGAVFTPTVGRGTRKRAYYSRWCDDCRRRTDVEPRPGDEWPDTFAVSREDAVRFLALADEYRALAAVADDPVTKRRLARAAVDYATMAARGR